MELSIESWTIFKRQSVLQYRSLPYWFVSYAEHVVEIEYKVTLLVKKCNIHKIHQLKTQHAFILMKRSWISAANPECGTEICIAAVVTRRMTCGKRRGEYNRHSERKFIVFLLLSRR
jgi:hypothetical protein